jgi:hypothetical protein
MKKVNLSPFLLLMLAVAIVVLGPLAVLFSLNTLFPVLVIPYNFLTWLAAFVLMTTVAPSWSKK